MSMILFLPLLGACAGGQVVVSEPCRSTQAEQPQLYLDSVRDGVGVMLAADQGTAQVQASLRELRVLTLLAAGGLRTDEELGRYETQAAVHRQAVERLALDTHFGETALLDGSSESFPVWVESACGESDLELKLVPMGLEALGVDLVITDGEAAAADLQALDQALESVALARSGYAAQLTVLYGYELGLAQELNQEPLVPQGLDPQAGQEDYAQGLLDAQLDNLRRAAGVVEQTLDAQDRVEELLTQMLALAEAAADPELEDSERMEMQEEVAAYGRGVDQIWGLHEDAVELRFREGPYTALVGQIDTPANRVLIEIDELTAGTLGVDTGSVDVSFEASAVNGVASTSQAIEAVRSARAKAEATLQVLQIVEESLELAE